MKDQLNDMKEQFIDAYVTQLRDSGCTITEAIKRVRTEMGVDLGEAKRIVSSHRLWQPEVKAAEALHDALERAIERDWTPFAEEDRQFTLAEFIAEAKHQLDGYYETFSTPPNEFHSKSHTWREWFQTFHGFMSW